eukprot:11783005-Alexandrium_andersonii.AAC.1
MRESVKHFRKWMQHTFDFGKNPKIEQISLYDWGTVERMCAAGVSPWGGRAILRTGHVPRTHSDFGFALGDEP